MAMVMVIVMAMATAMQLVNQYENIDCNGSSSTHDDDDDVTPSTSIDGNIDGSCDGTVIVMEVYWLQLY